MSKAFFSPTHALTKARKKQRGNECRVITKGTCYIDYKGRFPPSKDGGYTSILGFKHPASKHVHEHYLTNQRVDTTAKAFAHYKDMMKIQFGIVITEAVFDRDPSFNEEFSIYLRSIGVHPDTAGAEDHDKLGPIETYWDSWYTNVTAALTHADVDETHLKFASQMYNHCYNRLPNSGNEGSISPMEWLTYYTPDVSHFRAPFSPTCVVQPKNKQTNLRPRARAGVFCGYSQDSMDGVYTSYFPDTKSTQDSRHCVFNEHYHLRSEMTDEDYERTQVRYHERLKDMISRCEPMSTASAKAKPLVQAAVKSGGYFCANADAIQRAATQVRERCELLHGMAFDGVVGTRVLNKKTCRSCFSIIKALLRD